MLLATYIAQSLRMKLSSENKWNEMKLKWNETINKILSLSGYALDLIHSDEDGDIPNKKKLATALLKF